MIIESPTPDCQTRFRDEDGDELWADVMMNGAMTVFTIPPNEHKDGPHRAVLLTASERLALIEHLRQPERETKPVRKRLRVTWHHPAVLNGSPRVSDILEPVDGDTMAEHIARSFCPYGIEGADSVVITNVREVTL